MRPRKFECEESYRRNKNGHTYIHEMKEKLSLSVSLSLTLSGEHWTGAIQYQSKVMDRTSTPPLPTTRSLLHTSFPLTHSTSPIRFLPGLLTISLSLSVYLSLLSTCCIDQLKPDGYSLSPSLLHQLYCESLGYVWSLLYRLSLSLFKKRDNHHQQSRTRETLGDQSDLQGASPPPDIKETCEMEPTTYTHKHLLLL